MAYSVELSPTALQDLHQIADFIAQDNPEAALDWTEFLKEKAQSLDLFPERGKVYSGDYHILTVDKGYRIYYRVDEANKSVVVLHFFSPYQNISI